MSLISEAFDALTVQERLQLLADLEFEDPMRYAEWPEQDTRYMCLIYEVQSDLGTCFSRGAWGSVAAQTILAKTPKQSQKLSTSLPEHNNAVTEGIKAVRLAISYS